MKILWLQDKMGAFGGAEANVLATATALCRRGFENHLLYKENTGTDTGPWLQAFQHLHKANGRDAAAFARELQPDAVWVHNWSDSRDFPQLVETGFPVGRMVHDHALYCMRGYKYHPLTRRNCERPASMACIFPCMAFLQRGANGGIEIASLKRKFQEISDNRALTRCVVAGEFMKGELLKNGFADEKIEVIPPVPPEWEKDNSSENFVEGRILFVGQVIRGKGVDLLLRALAKVRAPWHFVLAGRGSALPKCEKLMDELGLRDRVTIHGYLQQAELREQYRQAQVVVVPSAWQEPFGLVGVEAMRNERAVIAFAVGGIPDWLEDGINGKLVPPADVDALADALDELLPRPDLCRRMGVQGRERAMTKFSFSAYVDKIEGFLRDLAGGSAKLQDQRRP
jgi:glycosyltransferase involved in cell wall biosynthesis